MKKIACLGTEAFTLGFQLAGIRITADIHDTKNILDQIHKLRKNRDIGLVIIDDKIMGALDSNDRASVEESIEPIFVMLSSEDSSESIRKLIIKSIGVDLWKGDS